MVLDLHTKNISFRLPDLDSWTLGQIHERFGEPSINKIFRLDKQPLGPEVPPYTVEPAYFYIPMEGDLAKQIKIIDFGEATFSREERKELHTPNLFRPPEGFFDESIGLSADIWTFACTVFDIFGKYSLFEAFMDDEDEVLYKMIHTLGMLPDRWWRKWENRRHYFLSDGTRNTKMLADIHEEPKPLAVHIQEMRFRNGRHFQQQLDPDQLTAEDAAGLQKLLASALRYEPSERPTAEEIVKSDWIQQLLGYSQT